MKQQTRTDSSRLERRQDLLCRFRNLDQYDDPGNLRVATGPAIMGRVLAIADRTIAANLMYETGVSRNTPRTGTVTLIQCFGSTLNLHLRFHHHTIFVHSSRSSSQPPPILSWAIRAALSSVRLTFPASSRSGPASVCS